MTFIASARLVMLAAFCAGCGAPPASEATSTVPPPTTVQPLPPTITQAPNDTQSAPPQEQPFRWMIDAKALSLREMTIEAERIFVGTVKEMQVKTVTLTEAERSVDADVRDVVIAVDEGIKGTTTGETITVRQLMSASSALRTGEQVMWFLPKPSHLGLLQPLGVFSGDFRVASTTEGEKLVQNLRGNAGLWTGSAWDEGFSRDKALVEARDRKLPQARMEAMVSAANLDPTRRQVPLELLLLLTKNIVKQ